MENRRPTKFTGVYESKGKRKHNGKPDIYYEFNYKLRNKKVWEKVGWASEGYNAKLTSFVRAERIRAIRHGEELPQGKKSIPFFRDLAKDFLEWAKTHRTRDGSDEAIRYKKHLAPYFENKRIDEITGFHLRKFRGELEKKGLSHGTIKHCLSLFRQIWNHARLDRVNPIREIKIKNPKNARERFFSYEEAKILLEAIKKRSYQFHDMCLLSLLTGLRHKEITGIKGRDLNFEHEIIYVTDAKNDQPDIVYMTDQVKNLMEKYRSAPSDEYVFRTKKGTRIMEVSDTFVKVINELGFNKGVDDKRYKLTFHSLRHTFASWLALQGEQLQTIQQLMRHKDITQTLRYSHLIPSQKKKAAVELGERFLSQSKELDKESE
jgi:integrase